MKYYDVKESDKTDLKRKLDKLNLLINNEYSTFSSKEIPKKFKKAKVVKKEDEVSIK